jgi:hypothetical protein
LALLKIQCLSKLFYLLLFGIWLRFQTKISLLLTFRTKCYEVIRINKRTIFSKKVVMRLNLVLTSNGEGRRPMIRQKDGNFRVWIPNISDVSCYFILSILFCFSLLFQKFCFIVFILLVSNISDVCDNSFLFFILSILFGFAVSKTLFQKLCFIVFILLVPLPE